MSLPRIYLCAEIVRPIAMVLRSGFPYFRTDGIVEFVTQYQRLFVGELSAPQIMVALLLEV